MRRSSTSHIGPCDGDVRRSLASCHRGFRSTGSFELLEVDLAPGRELPWHAHEVAMLVVVDRGGYELATRHDSWECDVSDLLFVPPGELHRERNLSHPTRACLITSPSSEHIPRELTRLRRPAVPRLSRELLRTLRDPVGFSLSIDCLCTELFSLLRPDRKRRGGSPPSWLRRIRELLEAEIPRAPSLERIAMEVGVSRSQVARAFRRWHGCSVGDYVQERRLRAAARWLEESSRPVAEIALEAGFYDQSHLGNAFRRRFGVTPGAYRRSMRRSS